MNKELYFKQLKTKKMKKIKSKMLALLMLLTAMIMFTACEKNDFIAPSPDASSSNALTSANAESAPITIFTSGPFDPVTSTATGTVEVSGAFNATGTLEMQIEFLGNAIHCNLVLTLPAGTITIRMNCNGVTFNGVWQILEGTGAYQNLKGNGSLVMPNDLDEILTGTVRGL